MISEEYNEPGVTLDYSLGGYAMLDQFGRIQGQEWSGASGLLDGYAAYDGAGRCISTLVAASTATDPTPITSTTDNYYAGQQVIQTHSAGSPQYQYVWSPLGSNSLILATTSAAAPGGSITWKTPTATSLRWCSTAPPASPGGCRALYL